MYDRARSVIMHVLNGSTHLMEQAEDFLRRKRPAPFVVQLNNTRWNQEVRYCKRHSTVKRGQL